MLPELYAIVCAVFAAQTDDLTFPTSWSQHACNRQMGKFQGLLTFTHDLLICWEKGLSTWISKKLTAYLLKIKSINHYSLFPFFCQLQCLYFSSYFGCTMLSKAFESDTWIHFSCSFAQGMRISRNVCAARARIYFGNRYVAGLYLFSFEEMALISSQHSQQTSLIWFLSFH